MGECGCGAFSPREVRKIGDKFIALEIYPGCEYCNTGVIVTLYMFDKRGAEAFGLEHFNPEEFLPGKHGDNQIDIPLIGPEDLIAAAKEIGETVGPDGYESLEDYLSDNALQLLQKALHHRSIALGIEE